MKDELKKIVELIKKQTGKTQQEIASELGYKKNYISEVLSPKGDVSDKFLQAIKVRFSDVLSSKPNKDQSHSIRRPADNATRWDTQKVTNHLQNDRLLEQIEARRQDFEKWAELARQDKEKADREKDRLLHIIENNLTLLIKVVGNVDSNLKTALEDLNAIEFGQRAQHTVMLHSLERIEKAKPGTLEKELSTLERAYQSAGEQSDKTAKIHK